MVVDGIGLTIQGTSARVDELRIQNLGATQFAAVRGIGRSLGVHLISNRGRVWVEDSSPYSFLEGGVDVVDCANVVLRHVNAFGSSQCPPTPGVDIRASSVALYECTILGGGSDCQASGGAGIEVLDSRLTLYASSVTGGGGAFNYIGGCGGGPGPGLFAESSIVEVIETGLVPGYWSVYCWPPGRSVVTSAGSLGAAVLLLPDRAHILTTSSPVVPGTTTVNVEGDPCDVVFAVVSLVPGPFTTLHYGWGPLLVPRASRTMFLGVVPGSGSFSTTVLAPPIPAGSLAQSFFLQPLFLGGGEIALGTPTQVHVLDPSL